MSIVPMPNTSQTGLIEVGTGVYAYVQPNTPTSWGWSNAGLVTAGGTSLLVDTLYTLAHTQEMLDAMRATTPAAAAIDVLVNSHADPDHTFGNQLVGGAQIISTKCAAEDMRVNLTPEQVRAIVANTGELGRGGDFFARLCAPFDFSGIDLVMPTETFTGRRTVRLEDKAVELIDVGPAHTRGDLIVHLPDERVVFVGDLLFSGAHAVLWSGPVSNWTGACDVILDLDVEVIVAGHGPLGDKADLREFRDYLEFLEREATALHARGMTAEQAAREIDLSPYADWMDAERIVLAMDTIFKGLEGNTEAPEYMRLFAAMADYAQERGTKEDLPPAPPR